MIVNKYKNGGGGSGSGSTYTAGEYISISEDVISVTGITPSEYLTTADTQDFVTSGDVKNQVEAYHYLTSADTQDFVTEDDLTGYTTTEDFDELIGMLEDKEETVASALTELHDSILEISGSTPDLSNYYTKAEVDAEITGATQDFVTEADVTGITSPIQTQLDDVERVTATALTELHDAILELSGDTPDMTNYYTKAEVDAEITGATEDFITSAYTGFTSTEDFDDLVESINTKEEVVASALTQLDEVKVESDGSIKSIIKISQAGYDDLATGGTLNEYTFYVITGSTGN